jgi:hypothetical protein
MSSVRVLAVLLVLTTLSATFLGAASAANWEPKSGEWSSFRQNGAHTAVNPNPAAFPASNLADLRIKWTHAGDMPFWVPPVAADMDGDGVAEVAAAESNVEVVTNPAPNLEFAAGIHVLNGATGALKWQVGPDTTNLIWFSPAIGDLDGDGKAELVFFEGTPITGNGQTNKLYAYSANGAKKWEWSDLNWPATKVPNAISAPMIVDVDGEDGKKEVVQSILLAKVDTAVNGNTLDVHASQPEFRIVALNGEGSPAISWQIQRDHGSLSSPAFADIDSDGKSDVVFGSGVRSGTLFDLGAVIVTLAPEFEDFQELAYSGGSSPSQLWSFSTAPVNGGDLATTPVLADLNTDGKTDALVYTANRPNLVSDYRTKLIAIRHDGAQLWNTLVNAGVFAPPAVGDLAGDARPEIVVATYDNAEGNRLLAFRNDGTLLWRSPAYGQVLNGAPAIADITGDGQREVLEVLGATTTQPTRLLVVNGQTGTTMWTTNVDADDTLGAPVIADLDGDDNGRPEILVNIGSFADSPTLHHSLLVAYEPELPDLVLSDLSFSASTHAVGEPETIHAKVTNQGSRAASSAVVRFLDEGDTISSQTVTLAPGASQTFDIAWTPANGGLRTVRAVADGGDAIPEWVETNNQQSAVLNVRSADFTFASGDPSFSDPNPGAGDTITVSGTVRNVGGKDASNVLVRFLDDGAMFAERTIASLPAGGSQGLSAALTVVGERNHLVQLVADPAGAVAEENEANNVASRLLNVRFLAPDLALAASDIAFSDPNPDDGDTLDVQATVHNQGSEGRTASNVLVTLLDGGSPVASVAIASIPSGGSGIAHLPYTIGGVGQRPLTVTVDPANAITELDETNNAASKAVVVGKVQPSVQMTKLYYGIQEQAHGLAHLQFVSTGAPLRGQEFTIPVEYVVKPVDIGDAPNLIEATAAVLAQVNGDLAQHVRVCVTDRCVDSTLDEAIDLARTVGTGLGAGSGLEVRWRLFTIDARTNNLGDAAFDVPMALAAALDALAGEATASVCPSGFDDVFGLAGMEPPGCVSSIVSLPGLPQAANPPGQYRATASVSWFGFGFAGGMDYHHL